MTGSLLQLPHAAARKEGISLMTATAELDFHLRGLDRNRQ